MKHIIITSNAPQSGKDTATNLIMSQFSHMRPTKVTMAYPLYEAIRVLFGIDLAEWEDMYEHEKDTPTQKLNGHSPRSALQWLAEDVMKPTYGVAHFGEVAAQKAIQARSGGSDLAVVSDGGFVDEIEAYTSIVGKNDCHIINIIRHEARPDTRTMVMGDDVGVSNYTVYNTGTRNELHYSLSAIMMHILRRDH